MSNEWFAKGWFRHWLRWIAAPMSFYVIVTVASFTFLSHHYSSPWRIPVALAPVVPIAIAVWGIRRRNREMDELERRVILETKDVALTAATLIFIAYGFLQAAGFPKPHPFTHAIALIVLQFPARLLARRKYA